MRKRVIVISLILAAVVAAVMVPRLRSSQFGILDDGVTLEFARLLSASMSDGDLSLFWRLEAERGRFRPFYWLYNTILYSIWRQDPFGYFLTNALVLLFTALSVAATVALATRNTLASLVAGLTYVLSPPVMENYFTLSKPEVPLTFLLGLSLCCWAGARASLPHAPRRSRSLLTVSALFLLGAYLTKETAQAMLLVSALWVLVLWVRRGIVDRRTEQLDSWYLGANLACVAIFWITRVMTGTVPIATGGDSGTTRSPLPL